jgi:hypothetical protein
MDMDRRGFLRSLAGTTLLISMHPPLVAISKAMSRAPFGENENTAFRAVPSDIENVPLRILQYAALAPSSHNAQPWVVKIFDDKLVIGSDRTRWLPSIDPDNRELLLSVGAFLENLILAAGHFGYRVEYRVIANTPHDSDLVEVRLDKAQPQPFQLERLAARLTVRQGQLPHRLKARDVMDMCDYFGDRAACFPPDSEEGKYFKTATVEATRAQSLRDSAMEELANWIRWSEHDEERHRTGLTPMSMGLSAPVRWYARRFMNRRTVLSERFRARIVGMAGARTNFCGAWMIITSETGVADLIETGRRFERMFIEARPRSIAVHPMNQMLHESPFRFGVASTLGMPGQAQFVLRLGYVRRYPDPVTPRMPLDWFVEKEPPDSSQYQALEGKPEPDR